MLLHHPEVVRPSGTAGWLRGSSCDQAYHVRRGSAPDLARLARLLTGRALGLVFGGGGARGFAHLGVLRAFEELGVPIDMVGGTSIGSLMAHLPAMGHGAAKALEVCEKNFRSLLDYTLPLASLVAGRRISNGILANAGDWDIEDLWLPYFCVSTNLTTSEAVIHRRGNLARAERASVAIPGVLPPVPNEGSLLIDGCVLNNVPIDVMRDLNPFGTVIAVDVGPPTGPRAKSDYGLSLSGWNLAARRLNPWKKAPDVPALSATIMFATMVGSAHTRNRALENKLADLYLPIHVRGVGLLEFDSVAKVAKLGYSESIERLRKWVEEERDPGLSKGTS